MRAPAPCRRREPYRSDLESALGLYLLQASLLSSNRSSLPASCSMMLVSSASPLNSVRSISQISIIFF